MSSVDIGKRLEKNSGTNYSWDCVENIPSDEVCVICMGGSGAHEEKVANKYAKKIKKEIVNNISLNIPVYSIKYNFEGNKKGFLERKALFLKYSRKKYKNLYSGQITEENENPQYIDDLYNKIIVQRISKNGKKIPLSEACKNIRKMTFIVHCHGSYVAVKLEEKMQKEMKILGYNQKEKLTIQKQMAIIAHSPSHPLVASLKSTFINFMSAMDGMQEKTGTFFGYYIFNKAIKDRESSDYFSPCFFKKQGNLFLIYEKYDTNYREQTFEEAHKEHNISFLSDKGKNCDGKILASMADIITKKIIRNSLMQTKNDFIPLPKIEDFFENKTKFGKTSCLEAFNTLCQNGLNTRKIINNYAIRLRKRTKARV